MESHKSMQRVLLYIQVSDLKNNVCAVKGHKSLIKNLACKYFGGIAINMPSMSDKLLPISGRNTITGVRTNILLPCNECPRPDFPLKQL